MGTRGSFTAIPQTGYDTVWESIETNHATSVILSSVLSEINNHMGTRSSFTARVPQTGYDTVWESIESLSTATDTQLVASVGTKPTTGRPLTEVELGALLLGYNQDGLIMGAGKHLGYAIALSKDGKWLAACSKDGVAVYYCDQYGSFVNQGNQGNMWGAEITTPLVYQASYHTTGPSLSVALSRDGETLAVGNPSHDGPADSSVSGGGSLPDAGEVRVYQKPATANAAWVLNSIIDGSVYPLWPQTGGLTGLAVAMNSSGTVIAVGAPKKQTQTGTGANAVFGPVDAGHVRVWTRESESASTWTKRGSDIVGGAAGDESGSSLALSENGLTVAVGSPKHDLVYIDPATDYSTHRFFGFAPTERSQNSLACLFGFSIKQAGASILPANFHGETIGLPSVFTLLAPVDVNSPQATTLQGSATHHQQLPAHLCWKDGWEYPWTSYQAPMWWEANEKPLFYVEATSTPDGSPLTCTFHQFVNPPAAFTLSQFFHPAGHIVSSATANGPWVVRATFDSSASATGITTLALNAGPPPHRYFGLVPTETTYAYEQWFLKGWEIQDSAGNNILSASTVQQHLDGDTVFELPHNYDGLLYNQLIGWVNTPKWTNNGSPAYGSAAYDSAAYDSYAALHGGVANFWEHGNQEMGE